MAGFLISWDWESEFKENEVEGYERGSYFIVLTSYPQIRLSLRSLHAGFLAPWHSFGTTRTTLGGSASAYARTAISLLLSGPGKATS
jgi:hypothetical protein